jgi:hypothetical protein
MSNLDLLRQEFEAWYVTQYSRDQIATWHPADTLFDSATYPNGRYTKMSSKQFAWEIWQAAKAPKAAPKAKVPPITLALDYDGTYTRDPDFWLEVIKLAQSRGHEVLIATMRTFEETDDMCDRLTELVHRIVPTAREAKLPFLLKFGIKPHIWIDDQPHFLLMNAQPIEDEKGG